MDVYLPGGRWYDWRTHERLDAPADGGFVGRAAPEDEIPVLARGGSVVAKKPGGRGAANTTAQSRLLPFVLRVYLSDSGRADGELYWDDGVSADAYREGRFTHVEFLACRADDEDCKVDDFSTGEEEEEGKGRSVLFGTVRKAGFKDEMALSHVGIFGVERNSTGVTFNGKKVDFYYDKKHQVIF